MFIASLAFRFTILIPLYHSKGLFLPGFHCNTCFGSLASAILFTCPNHISCLFFMSSLILRFTFIISLMLMLVTPSILDLPAALLQKSICDPDSWQCLLMFAFLLTRLWYNSNCWYSYDTFLHYGAVYSVFLRLWDVSAT